MSDGFLLAPTFRIYKFSNRLSYFSILQGTI